MQTLTVSARQLHAISRFETERSVRQVSLLQYCWMRAHAGDRKTNSDGAYIPCMTGQQSAHRDRDPMGCNIVCAQHGSRRWYFTRTDSRPTGCRITGLRPGYLRLLAITPSEF